MYFAIGLQFGGRTSLSSRLFDYVKAAGLGISRPIVSLVTSANLVYSRLPVP